MQQEVSRLSPQSRRNIAATRKGEILVGVQKSVRTLVALRSNPMLHHAYSPSGNVRFGQPAMLKLGGMLAHRGSSTPPPPTRRGGVIA